MNNVELSIKNKAAAIFKAIVAHLMIVTVTVVVCILLFAGGYFYGKYSIGAGNARQWSTSDVTVGLTQSRGIMIYNHETGRLDRYAPEITKFLWHIYGSAEAAATK